MKYKLHKIKNIIYNCLYFLIALLILLLIVMPMLKILDINSSVILNSFSEEKNNSYIKTEKETSILAKVIEPTMEENFNEYIEGKIKNTYPKFIVDSIKKDTVLVEYKVHSDYLSILYSNFDYEEKMGKIEIIINYKDIKSYLKKDFEYNEEYVFEETVTEKKYIAFTFDDGPHVVYTEQILQTLNDNKAKATFFMLGLSMENNQHLIKKVNDEGHEIGLHGYSHKNFTRMSINEVENELNKANDILYDAIGKKSSLVRPPYGNVNNNIKNNLNYSYILWNIDTDDWRYKDPEHLYNHVINNVKDGDIVLFHDIYETTANSLQKILEELYFQGYQVVDVSTLSQIKGQEILNNISYGSFN